MESPTQQKTATSGDGKNTGEHTQTGNPGKVQKPLEEHKFVHSTVPHKKISNRDFLEQKLTNCKTRMKTINLLKGTNLLQEFLKLDAKAILEWVVWIIEQNKTVDKGIEEMFAVHGLSSADLKPEEYEMIKNYFLCFQELATINY